MNLKKDRQIRTRTEIIAVVRTQRTLMWNAIVKSSASQVRIKEADHRGINTERKAEKEVKVHGFRLRKQFIFLLKEEQSLVC